MVGKEKLEDKLEAIKEEQKGWRRKRGMEEEIMERKKEVKG